MRGMGGRGWWNGVVEWGGVMAEWVGEGGEMMVE